MVHHYSPLCNIVQHDSPLHQRSPLFPMLITVHHHSPFFLLSHHYSPFFAIIHQYSPLLAILQPPEDAPLPGGKGLGAAPSLLCTMPHML